MLTEMVQRRQKVYANRHGKHKVFKKGDQVLVFNSRARKHLEKLKLRWMGPYIIKEEVAPRAFKLKILGWVHKCKHGE